MTQTMAEQVLIDIEKRHEAQEQHRAATGTKYGEHYIERLYQDRATLLKFIRSRETEAPSKLPLGEDQK